jgi:hypothetical protein
MTTLILLLYWPVVGLLIRQFSIRVLRREIGIRWIEYGIVYPLLALSIGVFLLVGEHLHGGLMQTLYGQRVSSFHTALYQLLYAMWMIVCLLMSKEPINLKTSEKKRMKKAAQAALAAGE